MAPKRKSVAKARAAKLPLEDCGFLETGCTASLYRIAATDPCRAKRSVLEEGEAIQPGTFPNPYLAIDFSDAQGVWQKETALSKALGEDPAVKCRLRDGQWPPAGLRNLGATCYLNSLLQYLFFNLDFRYSLLRAPSQSQVVGALQEVFALLAEGEALVVDPKDFVTAARVDALEQADATEFSALLLDWLQRELSACEGGAEFISALFEGQTSTSVQCSQDASHSSETTESFLELRAGLSPAAAAMEAKEAQAATSSGRKSAPKSKNGKKGKKLPSIRLEQILEETAFPEEILDGSNQWQCPRCERKVDARRTTRLSKLPPYLHITVERYHFDADTAQRKRLAHPVSFPRRLELRLGGPPLSQRQEAASETATLPVAYECIGYLEHVSDSAHRGHYRATLLREEEEPMSGAGACAEDPAEAREPAPKRLKVDGPDAAAGVPATRSWWRLDDETVTVADETPEGSGSAPDPERIESATAYLVLYRRCDYDPGQLCQGHRAGIPRSAPPLSEDLRRSVDLYNTELRRQRKEFQTNSLAVERFLNERRLAVACLAQALRQHAATKGPADLTFVPSSWLERFLRGEDRTLQNILEGDASIQPPIYSSAMVKGRNCPVAIDPLAIWCGEVKLLPTTALAQVGGQHGGLDSSTLLRVDEAMNEEVGQLVFKAFAEFRNECKFKAQLLSSRVSVTDVRNSANEGQQPNVAWVSQRQLNQWKKVVGDGTAALPHLWQYFVQEVRECRFGYKPENDEVSEDEVVVESQEVPPDVTEATTPRFKQLTLLGGLLCSHGLVCRPRAAALVSRTDLEELLKASEQKDRAFAELWPGTAGCMRPCVRSGLPGNKLLSFSDTCNECRIAPEEKRKARPQAKRKASPKEAETEGSAFNNSVFLSSASVAKADEAPILE